MYPCSLKKIKYENRGLANKYVPNINYGAEREVGGATF